MESTSSHIFSNLRREGRYENVPKGPGHIARGETGETPGLVHHQIRKAPKRSEASVCLPASLRDIAPARKLPTIRDGPRNPESGCVTPLPVVTYWAGSIATRCELRLIRFQSEPQFFLTAVGFSSRGTACLNGNLEPNRGSKTFRVFCNYQQVDFDIALFSSCRLRSLGCI